MNNDVFDNVPENFFNLLTNDHDCEVNADCFLIIFDLFKKENALYSLSTDKITEALASYFQGKSISEPKCKALEIIKQFCEVGWLSETDNKNELFITPEAEKLAEMLLKLAR